MSPDVFSFVGLLFFSVCFCFLCCFCIVFKFEPQWSASKCFLDCFLSFFLVVLFFRCLGLFCSLVFVLLFVVLFLFLFLFCFGSNGCHPFHVTKCFLLFF